MACVQRVSTVVRAIPLIKDASLVPLDSFKGVEELLVVLRADQVLLPIRTIPRPVYNALLEKWEIILDLVFVPIVQLALGRKQKRVHLLVLTAR